MGFGNNICQNPISLYTFEIHFIKIFVRACVIVSDIIEAKH